MTQNSGWTLYLLQESSGRVADEEAGLDEALAVPHQVVGEEARVNAVIPPAPDSVRHADHVRVTLHRGDISDAGVIRRIGGWRG